MNTYIRKITLNKEGTAVDKALEQDVSQLSKEQIDALITLDTSDQTYVHYCKHAENLPCVLEKRK